MSSEDDVFYDAAKEIAATFRETMNDRIRKDLIREETEMLRPHLGDNTPAQYAKVLKLRTSVDSISDSPERNEAIERLHAVSQEMDRTQFREKLNSAVFTAFGGSGEIPPFLTMNVSVKKEGSLLGDDVINLEITVPKSLVKAEVSPPEVTRHGRPR